MSDNFLSFVGKVGQSSPDNSAEKSPLAATKPTQTTDFKRIFAKESVSPNEGGVAKDAALEETKVAQMAAVDNVQDPMSDSTIAPLGPPIAPDNGNPLPKLSIYTPGLQVGRVILTTSSPKVNEDSLTAFARAQGINESVLKQSLALGPQMTAQQGATGQVPGQSAIGESVVAIEPNTEAAPSILSGLLSKSALARNPVEGVANKASPEALAEVASPAGVADSTLSALRAQQAFGLAKSDAKAGDTRPGGGELVNPLATTMIGAHDLRAQRQQTMAGDTRPGGGELVNPLATTMIGAHDLRAQRQQTIREGDSAQAKKEFTENAVDGLGKEIEAKILSEKLSISELRQARQAIDSAMEFARSNVQNGAENLSASAAGESAFAATSTLSAPPVSALQGATTSVAPVATSLGAVLSANDPSLMQARMQPYQDWAEKFGEVLGQKLSLAVKQGTWAVKLNLNPHSLGEIAISLEVGEKGIEGQLSANDSAVRQLMSDALPKLRSSLEELFGQSGNVNIEVGDDDASKGKQSSGDMVEIAIDLEDEIFNGNKVMAGSGITLRDGFDVLV